MPQTPNRRQQQLDLLIDPAVREAWLDARLPAFREAHPEIAVTVTAPSAKSGPPADFQAAVLIGDGDWADTTSELFMELNEFVLCNPSLLQGPKALSQAAQLSGFTLLHQGTPARWQNWLAAAGAHDVNAGRGPRFETAADCLAAAQAGEGMALANELTAAPYLQNGSLVKALPVTLPSRQAVYLVLPQARADVPAAAAFRSWLLRELRRWAAT